MKRSFYTLFVTLVALTFGTSAHMFAQEDAEARRQVFVQGFEQLLKNTDDGLNKSVGSGEKFAIAPVTVDNTARNLGIKVWFTLENGTAFNPVKRKMGAKERFYVHVQSAVPVYVSLFQNYPDSKPESRQVYPDKEHPETLKVIQAGVATKLPVPFEMDDNTLDEIMAMVVVRADAPQIHTTVVTTTTGTTVTPVPAPAATATLTVTSNDGVNTVVAQATASTLGTMKSINDGLADKKMDDPMKFAIATPTIAVTMTTVPNDVAFYMLGTGYAGQWQLTLKK